MTSTKSRSLQSKIGKTKAGRASGKAESIFAEELKTWVKEQRESVRSAFQKTNDAATCLTHGSQIIDALLKQLLPKNGEEIAIIAIGGYGRQDLFPHSDIDLLFLHAATGEGIEALAQKILYPLWDLKLQVGHAVRTVQQTIEACSDHTILTALLDARLVAGKAALYTKLKKELRAYKNNAGDYTFVHQKLEERDVRHRTWGDSRYMLEPNVKEGKGGLRDLHTLYWLARYCYDVAGVKDLVERDVFTKKELQDFKHAEKFLSIVRIHLHYLNGRGDDRLTFDAQVQIAAALGFRGADSNQAVERFMKRYFQVAGSVGRLTRQFCTILEADKKRAPKFAEARNIVDKKAIAPFILEGERLTAPKASLYREQPQTMMTLFEISAREKLDIHPRDLQLISRHLDSIDAAFRASQDVNRAFLNILCSPNNPELTLRHMSEVGLLGKYMPDFGLVTGQMQFDMYHIYTVDEHILRVVGILHDIAKGKYAKEMPVATEVMPLIHSPKILFVAAFTHDIAKGRGGEHATKGADIAHKFALQLGLTKTAAETVGILVEQQELLTETAFKRDLGDIETYRHLAAAIQSIETLRLLFLLTVGDVRAVGPNVWNGWKGLLLRDLYRRAERFFQTGLITTDSHAVSHLFKELAAALPDWSEKELTAYIEDGDHAYLSSRDATSHAIIANLLAECRKNEQRVGIAFRANEFHAITEMTVVAEDRYGLLADVAGAISSSDANIVGARIATLKSGWAVQSWQIQDFDKQAVTEDTLMNRLRERINLAIMEPQKVILPKPVIPTKLKPLERQTEVFIDNDYSSTYSILEVNALDRKGLLSAICRAIQEEGANIASAYISTYGEKAVDVFYIKDRYGFKISHAQRVTSLREHITTAIEKLR